MRIVHFCAGLQFWNGMANTARQFAVEDCTKGFDSSITNDVSTIVPGVDVVFIHGAWLPVLWGVSKRTKKIGARLVIRPAGSYDPVRLAYHGWKKRLVSFFEHRMLRRADVLLATCEAEAEWIRAYEPKAKNVELTDLKRFFNVGEGTESRVLSSELNRPLHLLYLGRRHPLKGVEFLEAAVEELNSELQSQNFELRIVSNASGDEKKKVWDWCDVLVLPTLSENFGRVVAEALERGKRVITTDGAPAWDIGVGGQALGVSVGYGGRLMYLKGYRDGTKGVRIELLKKAIELVGKD